MEDSSRLFVKNLPPSINEADFQRHFSAGGREVTDIKLIPKRRIAFVGYKTPQEAAKAAKYFNKSFIRMSRLSVEIARPILSDASLTTATKQHVSKQLPTPEPEPKLNSKAAVKDAEVHDKKRKRKDLEQSDPKLKEFLDVMRPGQTPSSKLEGILGHPTEADIADTVVPVEAEESDDEYEQIPAQKVKRQKKDDSTIPATIRVGPLPEEAPTADAPHADVEDASKTSQSAAATDDDWLRSRTNRLLDLLDPDDPAVTAPRPSQQRVSVPVKSQPADDVDMEDGDLPPDAVLSRKPIAETADDNDPAEQIRRTSRLFVRNLPYKATEAELREHFEKYGEVEEVSSPVFSYQVSVLVCDEPQIGTAYATRHLMRTRAEYFSRCFAFLNLGHCPTFFQANLVLLFC